MDVMRQKLINDAARILGNINQYYVDVESWNTNTRANLYPDAAPIEPDPTGEMARWKASLTAMLQREATLGHFPTVE